MLGATGTCSPPGPSLDKAVFLGKATTELLLWPVSLLPVDVRS